MSPLSTMIRLRPLSLAVLTAIGALALAPTGTAHATDLLQAYEQARQSDPVLAATDAQRLTTGEGVPQARSALLPQISADASLSKSDIDSDSNNQRFNDDGTIDSISTTVNSTATARSYGVNLTQSIFDYANYTRLRASRARAEQADYEYEAAADALMVRVSEAYFNTLTAIQTLASARAQERAVKRQLDQAEVRLEVGLAPITDALEARAGYDTARANAILAENALNDAREALTEITGTPATSLKGLGTDYTPMLPTPHDAEAWVSQAVEFNPTLLASASARDAAEATVGTARAGHLPRISASVGYGEDASWGDSTVNGLAIPADRSSSGPTYSVQLTVPLFTGGLVRSQVRAAGYQRDAAEAAVEQNRRAVVRQTRLYYRSVQAGISEIDARKAALTSAQSALEASEAGLEVGTRTIVDVLLSQQVLFSAQREYANAKHAFLVNNLRLKQSAGNIELSDMQAVNALLLADAEAPLANDDPNLVDPGSVTEPARP